MRSFVRSLLPWLLASPAHHVYADTPFDRAKIALDALQTWYNDTSGIWDTQGWWNGANAMTVVGDLALLDDDAKATATSVFENTYTQGPSSNPSPGAESKVMINGLPHTYYTADWPHNQQLNQQPLAATAPDASQWLAGYYDDDGWWSLAWIGAYDVTGNSDYLQLGEGIFDALASAWPTNCSNGGIPWNVNYTYVNAITNELFLSSAAHLANRVPDKKDYYIDWAQKEWNWFKASGMINADNLINDGLDPQTCVNNGQQVWTYNQGVVIGGLVELNKASPDSSYLEDAQNIALAAIPYLTDDNGVLKEVGCDPNCAPDGTQFKGVFMRNLIELHKVAPRGEYAKVIKASAESIWANDRDSENKLSVSWAGPFVQPVNASTHVSAMDALIANARLG